MFHAESPDEIGRTRTHTFTFSADNPFPAPAPLADEDEEAVEEDVAAPFEGGIAADMFSCVLRKIKKFFFFLSKSQNGSIFQARPHPKNKNKPNERQKPPSHTFFFFFFFFTTAHLPP